jgi:glycosyltransferase involved in cell wall biosynthesis
MKVLQILNSLQIGGAEKLITDSVPLYKEKGIKMDVVCLLDKKTAFWEELEEKQVKITGLTTGSVYNPFLIFKIIPLLKKYDIIHLHLFPVLYWVVLAKWISFSKTKLIYTEHNTHNKRREKFIFQTIDRYIYKGLDQIITISPEVENKLKEHLRGKEKDELIQNGVDIQKFATAKAYDKADFFDKDCFLLIQVSSFREQKDQSTLIKSLNFLPNNIKLLLVGDGPLKAENEKLVQELNLTNRVKFLGLRNDIPSLLHTADISILSSYYEGLSLACIEGMASGPFIASDVPGLREIVKGHGLLFERGNSKELASHIQNLKDNEVLYKEISISCYKRANQFDIEIMVNKYIDAYNKLYYKKN